MRRHLKLFACVALDIRMPVGLGTKCHAIVLEFQIRAGLRIDKARVTRHDREKRSNLQSYYGPEHRRRRV